MKPLSYAIRAEVFLQLSRLEAAGFHYDRAIAALALPSPAARRLKAMQALAAKGVDAAKAGEQSGIFTRIEAKLVRAAITAGSPAPTYQRLAEHYARRARQWSTLKSRLASPALVLVLALLIQPLPALIGGRIGVTGYAWGVIWPLLLIAALVAALRWIVESFPRAIPLSGRIFVRTNLRDFFESLALLLEAGVPALEALPAALDAVADGDIRRELARIRQRVEQQQTFAQALEGVSYLEGSPALPLAHTGEESGKLPEMLARHAEMESQAIAQFHDQVAIWLPRIVYALVATKVIAGIFASGGLGPRVPSDL